MEKVKDIILEEYKNNNLINLFVGKNSIPIKPNNYSPSYDAVDFDLIIYHLNILAEKDKNVQKNIDETIEKMIKTDYVTFYCAFSIMWSIAYDSNTKCLKVNPNLEKLLTEYFLIYKDELTKNFICKNLSYKEQIERLNSVLISKQMGSLL